MTRPIDAPASFDNLCFDRRYSPLSALPISRPKIECYEDEMAFQEPGLTTQNRTKPLSLEAIGGRFGHLFSKFELGWHSFSGIVGKATTT
jgi:hypothetical protein